MTAGVGFTAAGTTLGVGLRRLRRSNRVLPWSRSTAPLAWRWSPSASARLHRRLLRSAEILVGVTGDDRRQRRWGRRRPTDGSVLVAAGRQLLERAAAADARLAELRPHRLRWRRMEIARVAAEVAAVERRTERLVELRARVAGTMPALAAPSAGLGVDEMLDSFEEALRELRVQ